MPPKHEPMVMVKELCIDCAVCREVCPYTAVFFVPTKWKIALQVDQARCTGCGGPEHAPCVQFCPYCALPVLTRVTRGLRVASGATYQVLTTAPPRTGWSSRPR